MKKFEVLANPTLVRNILFLSYPLKGTEVQNYIFTKGIKKYDEFKNGLKSF